jgi:hypothetical protein
LRVKGKYRHYWTNRVFQRDTGPLEAGAFRTVTGLVENYLPQLSPESHASMGYPAAGSKVDNVNGSAIRLSPEIFLSIGPVGSTAFSGGLLKLMPAIQDIKHQDLGKLVVAEPNPEQRAEVIAHMRGLIAEERSIPQSPRNASYLAVAEMVLDFLEETLNSQHAQRVQ